MRVTVVGTGYVGLVSGTCFAETGNDVLCIDIDREKIELLQNGEIPIYEPGLKELVQRNAAENRLAFSTDIIEGIRFGEVIFCAVGTPPDETFSADLQHVKTVAESFGEHIDERKLFVMKSTVPVGTGQLCQEIISGKLRERGLEKKVIFDVVSNPEFLREGAAVNDTMKPERIIIGAKDQHAFEVMQKLYSPFIRYNTPLITTSIESAELIKYASNAFLATKISFINEIANFCEEVGADVTQVARGMGLDSRIGRRFLHAGIGYGGSCFPKDIQALISSGKSRGFSFRILEAVETVNNLQKKKLFHKLRSLLPSLEGKTIGVLGLAFKPKTDDMRDAPSIKLIKKLQAEGAKVRAYDPIAAPGARKYLAETNLTYAANAYDAAQDADALMLITEWDEFRNLDLVRLRKKMRGDTIFDGRNIFDPAEMTDAGFRYVSIGR